MISEPKVHFAQTVHLSCTDTNTVSKTDGNKIPQDPCHLGVSSAVSEPIYEPMVHSEQTCTYLHQDYHCLQKGQNELPLEPRPLRVSSGAVKTIFEPTVRLAPTMRLSCIDTNTISIWTETRFHMTHVTKEFHRVRQKCFLSLWHVRRKPCTYLASRLALSPNGLKRAFN
jgi:hypothetical protein